MDEIRLSPGPAAAYAFRLGTIAGAIVGMTAIGVFYFVGLLSAVVAGYVVLFLFPIYLVLVAVLLSIWLGYDPGLTSLRPVYQSK